MNTKLILTISIFVVLALGFGIYGFLIYKAKKLQKQVLEQSERETYQQLLKIRENIGEIPIQLKNYLKSKADDWDFEFNLNTIFINNAKNVLCISNDDLYVFAGLQEMSKREFFCVEDEFQIEEWNKLAQESNLVSLKPNKYAGQNLDLVLVYGTKFDNFEIYKNYFDKLNENGLIIINQKFQKRGELNQFIKYLNEHNIKHEVLWHKNKFLYISKEQGS